MNKKHVQTIRITKEAREAFLRYYHRLPEPKPTMTNLASWLITEQLKSMGEADEE